MTTVIFTLTDERHLQIIDEKAAYRVRHWGRTYSCKHNILNLFAYFFALCEDANTDKFLMNIASITRQLSLTAFVNVLGSVVCSLACTLTHVAVHANYMQTFQQRGGVYDAADVVMASATSTATRTKNNVSSLHGVVNGASAFTI